MVKNDQSRKQARFDHLEEGKNQRLAIDENREKIKRIQQKKAEQLETMGIESKYHYELKNKKITF